MGRTNDDDQKPEKPVGRLSIFKNPKVQMAPFNQYWDETDQP